MCKRNFGIDFSICNRSHGKLTKWTIVKIAPLAAENDESAEIQIVCGFYKFDKLERSI